MAERELSLIDLDYIAEVALSCYPDETDRIDWTDLLDRVESLLLVDLPLTMTHPLVVRIREHVDAVRAARTTTPCHLRDIDPVRPDAPASR